MPRTTTTTTEAQRALEQRGIAPHVAARLANEATPDLIGAWAAYAERNPRMPVGTVVNGIRHGAMPPGAPGSSRTVDPSAAIRQWLQAKLPEVCDQSGEPHGAAMLAAARIRFRYGQLNVREHAKAIRGAVLDAEAEAEE